MFPELKLILMPIAQMMNTLWPQYKKYSVKLNLKGKAQLMHIVGLRMPKYEKITC